MSKPITVLHIVFSLDPGGMENGLVNMANQLTANEFQVDVCCLEREGSFADRLPGNSKVTVLNKQPGKSTSTIWNLFRLIRESKPDIIHSHNLGPLIYAAWSTLGGRLCPILHGEHGEFPKEEMSPKRLKQRRRYYTYCKHVHTVSDSLCSHIASLNLIDPWRLSSIRNGVDTKRFQPTNASHVKKELKIPRNLTVLGSVGRFIPSKQYAELMDAFDQLANPNLALLLVGDGERFAQLKEKRKFLDSRDRIFLPGYLDKPEVAYSVMDLFVLPSQVEGLSNVMLEAMACERPCLVNDSCGSGDVIVNGVNGFQNTMNTVDEIKTALQKSLDIRERWCATGTKARETVKETFSISSMARKYADIYTKIMEQTI